MKIKSSQFMDALIERTKDLVENVIADYPDNFISQVSSLNKDTGLSISSITKILDYYTKVYLYYRSSFGNDIRHVLEYENFIREAINERYEYTEEKKVEVEKNNENCEVKEKKAETTKRYILFYTTEKGRFYYPISSLEEANIIRQFLLEPNNHELFTDLAAFVDVNN